MAEKKIILKKDWRGNTGCGVLIQNGMSVDEFTKLAKAKGATDERIKAKLEKLEKAGIIEYSATDSFSEIRKREEELVVKKKKEKEQEAKPEDIVAPLETKHL